MCRHVAYLGPPRTLAELLTDPPIGLLEQSHRPRRQAHGRVNADGFGLGWWDGGDPPRRYRRAIPIWADENLDDLAGAVCSGAALSAVRDQTDEAPVDASAVAPFRSGARLFSLNGAVRDWQALPDEIATGLRGSHLLGLASLTDAGLVWAMVDARLTAGASVDAAVEAVVADIVAVRPDARLNLVVMERHDIWATRWGDSLVYRSDDESVYVASEPIDESPGWREVPQHHLIHASITETAVRPLSAATEPSAPGGAS
jgi:glutamine amidotransferase